MTVKEVAEYLKLTPATIYKLARSRKLPAAKVASEWRFPKELIDEWLSKQAMGGKAPNTETVCATDGV
jgi:excisionase family DNA binding protein